jgi:hypothetical protein
MLSLFLFALSAFFLFPFPLLFSFGLMAFRESWEGENLGVLNVGSDYLKCNTNDWKFNWNW